MSTEAKSIDPDHARKVAAILSIQPDDARGLAQYSPVQRQACEWAIRWIHDFNLGRMPRPNFSDEVLGRLSDFHEEQMNERLRQEAAAPTTQEEPADHSLSPQMEDFIDQMIHNLNTHQPGVPRGQNVGNCQQPEYTLAEPLPPPPASDRLAEWSRRALAGMKRMAEDPEHRASIEKRIS